MEDILSVTRGVQTVAPCHNCKVFKDVILLSTNYRKRTIQETFRIVEILSRGYEDVGEEFKSLSNFSLKPLVPRFPLVDIHSSVDVYIIFWYDPMHNLNLGISQLLK